ncbi:carbonic anhydrase [Pelagicoccus sp. NFK12]|uniref:carbonic anhydrase n=1 Tax=Pelagicoccus enzymogenes TaxID=2773457 RepID=A0A927F765_9BACT|nr:carbonic anhydrase [Pelagicoccus enzymogenes]
MPDSKDTIGLPDSLIEGHESFLKNDYAQNPSLFADLASGQSPKVMWIGCVDSRVPAERILGAELGQLFVLRNVANIVPPLAADEASVGSAVFFAVENLKVEHIIVCGHSNCGGVRALSQLGKASFDPMLSSWVEYAIPALEDYDGSCVENLARANVVSQTEHLLEYPCVADAVAESRLSIHSFYYEIGKGKLERFDTGSKTWSYLSRD